jgi:ABC-2 type transport system permease protein
MQIVLLAVIMIGGIAIQSYNGFWFWNRTFFELYAIKLVAFVIWAFLALFIQTLFKIIYGIFCFTFILSIDWFFLPNWSRARYF